MTKCLHAALDPSRVVRHKEEVLLYADSIDNICRNIESSNVPMYATFLRALHLDSMCTLQQYMYRLSRTFRPALAVQLVFLVLLLDCRSQWLDY